MEITDNSEIASDIEVGYSMQIRLQPEDADRLDALTNTDRSSQQVMIAALRHYHQATIDMQADDMVICPQCHGAGSEEFAVKGHFFVLTCRNCHGRKNVSSGASPSVGQDS